jgi:hypothetical protein
MPTGISNNKDLELETTTIILRPVPARMTCIATMQ